MALSTLSTTHLGFFRSPFFWVLLKKAIVLIVYTLVILIKSQMATIFKSPFFFTIYLQPREIDSDSRRGFAQLKYEERNQQQRNE